MNTGPYNPSNHSDTPDASGEVLHEPQTLPHVSAETSHFALQSEQLASKQAELPPSGSLTSVLQPTQGPIDPSLTALQPALGSNPTNTSHSAAPISAEDSDLIEKEWVLRAKALVAKTKDDPHQQNQELSLYKADYIKKRYNKDIKVSEG